MSPLADLLGKHLHRTHTSVNRLFKLSGVPQRTIANWLNGSIRKPQQWQGIVKVALALHLSEPETEALLEAAGHSSLTNLRAQTTTASEQTLLSNYPIAQYSIPNSPSPFQAIADLPTFVGRENELETVKRAVLNGGRAAICGLRGMGGVGKTALAAHLAYHVRDQFPDGVLWARLDTSDPLSILGTFADAYGKDVSQYKDVESRAAVVRNLLAEKRILVVLDNVETSAQVRSILPPSTGMCAVLITTRQDLSVLDGWERLTLEPFEAASEESLQLFREHLGEAFVGRYQTALREISALLGHLPLALAIAAGLLANARPRLSEVTEVVSALLAALTASHTRLDALTRDDLCVRASFDASYAVLPIEQQAFFATLGVFSGDDFGVEAVAFLNETSLDETPSRLETLVALSLVQTSQADRYRLHPLLRDYAREKLNELSWMAPMVHRTLLMFQQAAQGQWQFSHPLHTEILNVRYALDQAADLRLRTAFIETVTALYDIWASSGWLKPSLPYWEQACTFARELGETTIEIRLTTWYASYLHALGEIQAGQQKLYVALEMAQTHQVVREMADILCALGKSYFDRGEYAQARPYYEQSLELAVQVDYTFTVGRNLNNLGLLEHVQGHYSVAEALFTEAITHLQALDAQKGVATVMMNLSNVYGALGQAERTTALRKEALERSRQENHRAMIITLLLNLADGYALFYNDLDTAERLLLEALDMAMETGFRRLESQLRVDYANVLRRRGHFAQAEQEIQGSLTIAQQLTDVETHANALRLQGELFLDMGRLADAKNVLEIALQIAHRTSLHGLIAEIHFLKARIALIQAQFELAYTLAQESLRVFEEFGPPYRMEMVRRWLENLEMPIKKECQP